jgi:glycosyltransferase involved in cell wall biosynthesis
MISDIRKPAKLSVVVPCYNEEDVLQETTTQLVELLEEMEKSQLIDSGSHVCFVDDGSKDRTWALIREYSMQNSRIRGIKLSRNRGHQFALLAGLENAEGDVLISIDADLQDDITVIKQMMEQYHLDNDVVYGVRKLRTHDSFFKRTTAQGYYYLLKKMGVNIIYNHADFRLMSRRAIEALKRYEEVNLFLRGIIPTIGFPSTNVEYDRAARFAGESKYPIRRMLSLAVDGITSFSSLPLRFIAGMGMAIFLLSLILSCWVLFTKLFSDNAIPGWASSVLPMYLLGGIQLLSIGVLGEYVAKMYMETKSRPRYFIQDQTPLLKN